MSIVKVQHKGQMTIPRDVRSSVGLADGDLVDVKAARGRIIITPQLVIDRSKFPTADDEYTPEQRRIIDREIANGLADFKAGLLHGPFHTHEDMVKFLHAEVRKARERNRGPNPSRDEEPTHVR